MCSKHVNISEFVASFPGKSIYMKNTILLKENKNNSLITSGVDLFKFHICGENEE